MEAQKTLKKRDTERTEGDGHYAFRNDVGVQLILRAPKTGDTKYGEYPHSDITEKIIVCAIEVHRTLGPGFVEVAYENALLNELNRCGLEYEQQKPIKIRYKGVDVGRHRLDLVVAKKVVVELKAVKTLSASDTRRLLSYLKATNVRVGLLLNFAKPTIEIKRLVL